ncbi:MAG: class I SAM-dependent methyltransferase [Patescibacteria group bacterium]
MTLGWGKVNEEGVEIWDTNPVFLGDRVAWKDWVKLLFYPKKFLLYRWIKRNLSTLAPEHLSTNVPSILDVGCGTGASVIDLKKIFGRGADVVGVDVVKLQIELAQKKIKQYGVVAEVLWYDGKSLPFPDASFDAIYTSDVLGHVADVPAWLKELNRVLKPFDSAQGKPGGVLAMFSESKLGKHAWIRKYLFNHGLNVDPHAQFHISLYSKSELKQLIANSGFEIKKMYSVFWPAFLLHPEEFYEPLQSVIASDPKGAKQSSALKDCFVASAPRNDRNFTFLRALNCTLCLIKKKTHPYSTAVVELYGLIEMVTIGRWVKSQGYIILAKKE